MKILSPGIILFESAYLQNEELIAHAEASTWRAGTVGSAGVPDATQRITDVHDLDEKASMYPELLEVIIDAVSQYGTHYKVALSKAENFRIGRYVQGAFYKEHIDSSDGKRTVSMVLYLNSDYSGGEIYFPFQDLTIKPSPGDLLLFPSNFAYRHECKPIVSGQKYIVFNFLSA